MENLSTLKELGIAGVAIGAMAYLCFKSLAMLAEVQKDYKSFVLENNHTMTDLVREATQKITESNEQGKAHTEVIQAHTKILEKLIDRLDK